jgi:hypothetical protein
LALIFTPERKTCLDNGCRLEVTEED